VGLEERARHLPNQLSGGEQQRVCIARALINRPQLILADEPTGNLDEANEGKVLELLRELHQEGRTVIVVTHDPEVAEQARRTIVLEHGRVHTIRLNRPDEAEPDGAELDGTEPGETTSDGTELDETKSDGTEPDEADSGEAKSDGTEPDETDPDGAK
jgi:energy-coupling factor transporter ATP-binding protein EcfA2